MNKFLPVAAVWTATFFAVQPAASVHAAEMKPVAVVSIAGYDALKKDLQTLGELAATPELAQMADGFVAFVLQGLPGLDRERPLGLAVVLSEDLPPRPEKVVAFIPVSNADRLLESLAAFVTTEDLGDGLLELRAAQGPDRLMARKQGNWLYLAESRSHLEDLPDDPSTLLGDLPKRFSVAARLTVQNVPEPVVEGLLDEMKRGAGLLGGGPAGLDDAQREIVDGLVGMIEDLIHDADALTLGAALDTAGRSIQVDYEITLKAGTPSADELNEAKTAMKPSRLAGLADSSWAANAHVNLPLYGDSVEQINELVQAAQDAVGENIDNIEDFQLKQIAEEISGNLFDVLKATVEEGQLNAGVALIGKGPYSIVLAAHTADAKKLDDNVRKILELAGSPGGGVDVKLDAGKEGDVVFHEIAVPPIADESFTENAILICGTDELKMTVGFGKQTIIVAMGAEPTADVSAMLRKGAAAGGKLPAAQFQLKMGPIMELSAKQAGDPMLTELARLLKTSENDHMTFTLELIPNGERMRLQVEEGVISAFGKAVKQQVQSGLR